VRRGWLLNIVLLVTVTALAWFAWYMPSREEAARVTLSPVKPAAVARIVLKRQGRPAVELERRGQQWWITAPLKVRADEFQVMRMLTILEAQPTARLPGTDRARFGLDPPAAVLDIDGVQYAFGGINSVTREQYVLHGDTIHAVELRHGAALPADAGALIRRALLGETDQPVAVTLPEFAVRKTGGKWTLTPPANDISADDLQRYVDQWRMASAAAAETHDGRPALGDIQITLPDDTTLTFGILQREPQLVLWRREHGLQYTFSAAAGRVLLANPAARRVDDKK